MKFIVSGKNLTVTDALKETAIKKLSKLEKFFNPDTEVHVTFYVEKKIRQIFEVTIHFHGIVLRVEEAHDDMYTSIDKAVDVLERQIRKNKTKLEKKLKADAFKSHNYSIKEEIEEEDEFKIARTKRFAIKPMKVEEAILQMNLIGHAFYMFSNADTNEVNVVYKRNNGDYGLIEPEF